MNERHLERVDEISREIVDFMEYSTRWRATLRQRFDECNGLPWVRYLRNHFDTEKVFRDIKKHSTQAEIQQILIRRTV